jgi:hypothetical protein
MRTKELPQFSVSFPVQAFPGKPACMELSLSQSFLFLGTQCGLIHKADVHTLMVSEKSVTLHGSDRDSPSAILSLGEDSIITADSAGILHALQLCRAAESSSTAPKSTTDGTSGTIVSRSLGQLQIPGGVFDISQKAMEENLTLGLHAEQSIPLSEVHRRLLWQVRVPLDVAVSDEGLSPACFQNNISATYPWACAAVPEKARQMERTCVKQAGQVFGVPQALEEAECTSG